MNEEVSKASIAVMLILTLIISVLSTLTILKSMENPADDNQPVSQNTHTGQVRLSIDNPEPVTGEGQISLSIRRAGDN